MKIVAIALAGGKSSRMGRDKSLLRINGETLLWKACRTALQVADSVYIVVRSQTQYQEAIAEFDDRIFTDRAFMVLDYKFDGALVGFWQGMNAIANTQDSQFPDWILLLACDLPNINSDTLQIWINHLADLPTSAIAYLPKSSQANSDDHSAKSWEPLCGFYRWQCRDSLTKFIADGGRSFQKYLGDRAAIEIPDVPHAMLFNCNTPEDFHFLTSI
jgi:molybdopterin-guanine dinucleotide biosynthesis protein A